MRSKECRELLARLGFGRLACASNNRPYIVPIYFALESDRLYCFSTRGRKIEWMRLNPLVCVQVDDVRAHDRWESVVVFGQYVEIPNTPEFAKGREHARSLLRRRAMWWQSGYPVAQLRRQPKPPVPVFFCIQIEEITGLRACPDIAETPKSRAGAVAKR